MGQAIIEALESGLGVIEALAQEFLKGFEKLVWVPATTGENAVPGHLTSVATFAFVMLGVSVSFAIIKKIFNVLSGNTGM